MQTPYSDACTYNVSYTGDVQTYIDPPPAPYTQSMASLISQTYDRRSPNCTYIAGVSFLGNTGLFCLSWYY